MAPNYPNGSTSGSSTHQGYQHGSGQYLDAQGRMDYHTTNSKCKHTLGKSCAKVMLYQTLLSGTLDVQKPTNIMLRSVARLNRYDSPFRAIQEQFQRHIRLLGKSLEHET
jgi:hypothetical protein